MAGPAALVSLFHLLHEPVPGFGGEHFWSFPGFGALCFPLPTHLAGKEGDAVSDFWAVAFRLFRPFDGSAHAGKKSEFAAGGRFPGETFRFLEALFFRLCGPVVPRFSKSGVLAGEADLSHPVGGKNLGNGILALGNK